MTKPKVYNYQPGNGTRYIVFALQIEDKETATALGIDSGGWLIGWIDKRFYAFQPTGKLSIHYVAEKFDIPLGSDSEAIMMLISHITGRKADDTECELWSTCEQCGLPCCGKDRSICVSCEYS